MSATFKPFPALTAADVMVRGVVTIPHTASLREAAHLLREANVSGAAVVDKAGRCVGVLSTFDFLRWAERPPGECARPGSTCPYLARDYRKSGDTGWICVLAAGQCPFQESLPTTGGRHISICRRPGITFTDWQHLTQYLPDDSVQRYMTASVVTAKLEDRLPELAHRMFGADVHRLFVIDEAGRPIGVVSSTNLLAALAAEGKRPMASEPELSPAWA
jgi:CBS-domain-containing membrane protein